MTGFLNNEIFSTITSGLDTAAFRHALIANNLANVETFDYKRKDVNFNGLLKSMISNSRDDTKLAKTSGNHMNIGASDSKFSHYGMYITSPRTTKEDKTGNNVNIDMEMAQMAKNTLYYETVTELMSRRFRLERTAITGRG